MKRFLLLVAFLAFTHGCVQINATDWVKQDRDNFYKLDTSGSGLDAWIEADAKLSVDEKDALHAINKGRRVRVARGCELAGIPATPTAVPE